MELFNAIFGVVLMLGIIVGLTALRGLSRRGKLDELFRSPGSTPIGTRDEVFEGVPLGVLPSPALPARTRSATRDDTKAPVAVRFEPPQDLLPEQTGMLRFGRVQGADLSAALMALVVEGHVRMTRHEVVTGHGDPHTEWWLSPLGPPAEGDLRAWLFHLVTDLPPPGNLDDLKRLLSQQDVRVREDYAGAPRHREWFPRMKDRGGHFPPFGAQVRSAEGAALRYQLAGFHQFLETADGDRLRFEEGAGLFTRYLPWAVALGVAQEWRRALQDAAAGLDPALRDRWHQDLAWCGGVDVAGGVALGVSVDALSHALGEVGDLSGGDGGGGLGDLGGFGSDGGAYSGGDGGGPS